MGTISDKLMRIINTKEDIRQALISKGYDVPTSIPFKEYAKMISDLPCRVDSFPDIEGIVARYSALGLTNEQMAANPVWVDKTGNGHDLQMKNFAWKEGSGISDIYPGALVFDGVDDYGTCENFPILTKEKGYTVVVLRQWLSFRDIGYPTLVVNSTDRLAAFSFEDFINETKSTWNWGRNAGLSDYKIPLLYTYQTSTSYNSKTIHAGATEEGSNILQVCRSGVYCANAAIWEIVILDHDATEEELTKIKDYFVKTYPWLFPDQAWTVTGKTNEDEDRATIANITGNGNDLVLSNFGFAEGSGYNEEGEYAGYLVTDGVDDKIDSSIFKLGKDFTVVGEWEFLQDINNNSGLRKTSSFIIRNNASGLPLFINRTSQATTVFNVKSLKAFCSNGLLVKNDWTEQIDTVSQIVTSSNSKLSIACRDDGVTEYDKFAFKNLAIYPMVLSKDDCIKAYNYLQTLKAK